MPAKTTKPPKPTTPPLSPLAEAVLGCLGPAGRTFSEVGRFLHGRGIDPDGELGTGHAEHNVIIWDGMSPAFAGVMRELRQANAIHLRPVHWLVYLHDGGGLRLPIAVRPPKGGYKEPHWLPAMVHAGPDPEDPRTTRSGA